MHGGAHHVKVFLDNPAAPSGGHGIDDVNPNTILLIPWTTVLEDADGFWSSANPTRLTVPASFPTSLFVGFAQVSSQKGAGDRLLGFYANGFVNNDFAREHRPGTTGSGDIAQCQGTVILGPGEYVELQWMHKATTVLDVFGTAPQTWLSLVWMGFV